MKRFREAEWLRFALLIAAMAGFLLATLMAISPGLHSWVHQDADHEDHACLATFIRSGDGDAVQVPVAVSLAAPLCVAAVTAVAQFNSQWVEPLFLRACLLEHGPPALS